MKKNFVVAIATKQEYEAFIAWAKSKGYRAPTGGYVKNQYVNWRADLNQFKQDRSGFFLENGEKYGPIIAFAAFAVIQDIELGPAPVTIQLTDTYNATIDYATKIVKVGCQEISFDKVERVHTLLHQHDEQKPVNPDAVPQSECDAALRNALYYGLTRSITSAEKQAVADYLARHGFKVTKA